ncbi:MAG: methionyl-tRNA formyltransferase [Calditrichaeota bacterium]|nr:methionyl-tRNA formyltransferase [Calditrichota bacterium]
MCSKSKLKIILMGGNLIGCKILRYLFRMKNVSIPLVVSQWSDNGAVLEPNGWNASLTRVALAKGLRVIQPISPHSSEFLQDIHSMERPDLIITAEYNHFLDPSLLALPKIGTINVHFSKLPRHRGDLPFVWSVFEDDEAGVTIHWVDEKIHAGDIIAQDTTPISKEDTSFTIYNRLTQMGIKLFNKYFPKIISGTAPRIRQNHNKATFHAAGYPNQCLINWSEPAEKIRRLIHALDFPDVRPATTFVYLGQYPIEIVAPAWTIAENSKKVLEPGEIVSMSKDGVKTQTGDGQLYFKHIVFSSRNKPARAEKIIRLLELDTGGKFTSFNQLKNSNKLNLVYSDYYKFSRVEQRPAS